MPANEAPDKEWDKSQSLHDIANCNSRSGKQSAQSTKKEDGDADQLGSPSMRRGPEIGGEA
jgi:hypothetical protein